MGPPPNYIDLSRRFVPLRQEAAAEDSAVESYARSSGWLLGRTALGWDDLLKRSLVVVLGEPGSGKTYEMQNQAASVSAGRFSFFIRLDELASSEQGLRLSGEESQRFEDWRQTRDRAVFFLDSVDEAKIHQAADFYRGLDRFREALGPGGCERATIIISSRITEWLPTNDGHEVRARFTTRTVVAGATKLRITAKADEPFPFVVQLLPLNNEAVARYANARGVSDAVHFLDALETAHAWELARRPADVDDLLSFWRENGTLGTLTEILTFVCDRQLRKTSDRERSEVLALERARSGAECLAAATILCRKFIFGIPGETNVAAQALDALACLPPDWRAEEVRALFNHAIFDGASYGHIRFHHRRISEFLAAQWFEKLLAHGCPVVELENLLFDTRSNERILRPSLAPLAAWLCGGAERWNLTVCRWVLEAAPESLLRYGDPTRLPIDDRRALLRALSKKADGRERLWWEHDHSTLSRLAHPDLAPEINELLTSPTSGQTLRELGLEIVTAGRVAKCSRAALDVAIADLSKGEIFPTAARALTSVASESDLQALAAAAKTIHQLPERVCVSLCELLFPRVWSVSELFHALSRVKLSARHGVGWDYSLARHLESTASEQYGLALLRGLLGYPPKGQADDDDFEGSWNVRIALSVANAMLCRSALSDDEALAIAEVLIRASGRGLYSARDDQIPERSETHPKVRERYFHVAAERMAAEHDYADASLSSIAIYYDKLRPMPADLVWILQSLTTAPSDNDKEKALRWALELWHQTGRSLSELAKIRRAVNPFPNIRRFLWKHLHPGLIARAKWVWYSRIRHLFYRYRWRMAWHKLSRPIFKLRDTWRLWHYRHKLSSGEYIGWLVNLVSETLGESQNQWVPSDWSLLEKKRGMKCARAVRDGCKLVWKRFQPPLPHEKEPNKTAYQTIVGLAGIMAAWQDGELKFEALSLDDARRATCYALSELNGFAPWFFELVQKQPEAVRSVLAECIVGEWDIPADSEHYHLVMNDLVWSGEAASHLVKPVIIERLSEREPKNSHILHYALCILVTPPTPLRSELAVIAASNAEVIPVCAPSFPQWMALWLQVDALPAVESLEKRLATATDPTRALMRICSHLGGRSGDKLALLADPSWLTPAAMRRFLPLVYRHIRREDDIDRSGGEGYSPTARDDAQDFRGGLLERFAATKDPEVEAVLRDYLAEPLLSHLTDYIRHLLDQHREQLAELPVWRASDVRIFATDYEREPQTDADLFRIGLRRLADLKSWVETGEDSPRDEVNPEKNEAGFRIWLQRRLNEKARGRYVVPAEWEIDGRARPDLRLVIPSASPVSLELKIADKWTLQELLDGLEKQLVGTYLRDRRARNGVYVLALFNRDRKWESLDGGRRINCDEMLAILIARARDILRVRADIAGLEVVLIHFSPPPL